MYRLVFAVLPYFVVSHSAFSNTYFNPHLFERSSRESTLGVGSMAAFENDSAGILLNPNNRMPDGYKFGLEYGMNQGVMDVDYRNSGSESNLQQQNIRAMGLIPLVKLAGASSATGIGFSGDLSTNSNKQESDLDSYKSESETDSTNIAIIGSVGLGDFIVGARYKNSTNDETFEDRDIYDFGDGTVESEDTSESSYSMQTWGFFTAWESEAGIRLAAAYSPRRVFSYQTKYEDNEFNLDDQTVDTRIGRYTEKHILPETYAFATGLKIPASSVRITGGIARQMPYTETYEEEGYREETEFEGTTNVTLGAELPLKSVRPRLGLHNTRIPDGWSRGIGAGVDYTLSSMTLTADAGYSLTHYEFGQFEANWENYQGSLGLSTAL